MSKALGKATYVVLEIPDPPAEKVMALRRRFDPPRTALPIEITLIGSSGVGTIQAGQDREFVFDTLAKIAQHSQPFDTRFVEVCCFPGTQIYWLKPESSTPFVTLHERIKNSGLKFNDTPFPYTPYCTIADLHRDEHAGHEAIAQSPVPCERFEIDTMSAYMLDDTRNGLNCSLVWQARLGE